MLKAYSVPACPLLAHNLAAQVDKHICLLSRNAAGIEV